MKNSIVYIVCFVLTFACKSAEYDASKLENLKEKEAKVEIKINNKLFYGSVSVFNTDINTGDDFLGINFTDQFGGNLQLQLSRGNWFSDKNKPFTISSTMMEGYPDYGNMLIGKRDAEKLEGYVLTRGKYQWLEISKELAVLKCKGFVIKPQDAAIEENEIPFEGNIYINKPMFKLEADKSKTLF